MMPPSLCKRKRLSRQIGLSVDGGMTLYPGFETEG
jgi:hypothetical protein